MTIEKYEKQHTIIDETRRSIIDALLAIGSLTGDMHYHQFAKNVCPINLCIVSNYSVN